jgi:hypothetical protein
MTLSLLAPEKVFPDRRPAIMAASRHGRLHGRAQQRTRRGAGTARGSRRIRIEIGDRPGIVECDAGLSRMSNKELA